MPRFAVVLVSVTAVSLSAFALRAAERVSKATVEDVGWPLDLNKPKDRESVDKAISFHDL